MTSATRPAGGAGRPDLDPADLRAVLRLLEECERAPDLARFRETTVESLARFFGVRHATFFLGSSLPELFADPAPVATGRAGRMVSQYVEDAHRRDPFAQPTTLAMYGPTGVLSLDQLAPLRAHPLVANYLERFLFPGGVRAKLVVALPGDRVTGGIGLLAEESGSFGPRERELARLLGRHLGNLLRLHRPEPAWGAPVRLPPRQAEVVRLVGAGLTNREIADALVITVDTVKKHLRRAMDTTGCANRTQLAMRFAGRED
jgi:DNA-binding CsgD family transcriptional regulator